MERQVVGMGRVGMPDAVVAAIAAGARGKAELAALDKFHNLSAPNPVGIEKPRQRAVEEALPEPRQWPRAGRGQSFRPIAVDIAGGDALVEETLGFERCQHTAAQRLVRAAMAGAEIDRLETIGLVPIREGDESVICPNRILCRLFGISDLRLHVAAILGLYIVAEH